MDLVAKMQLHRGSLNSRLLSSNKEIFLVVLCTLGPYMYEAVTAAIVPNYTIELNKIDPNRRLAYGTIIESLSLSILIYYLAYRQWTMEDVGLRISWKGFREAISISFVALLLSGSLHIIIAKLGFVGPISHSAVVGQTEARPYPVLMLTYIVINAVFEQTVCLSYLLQQLFEKYGLGIAVAITTTIRMSYHLWQHAASYPGTAAVFIFYCFSYCLSRNIWPLIAAQIMVDIFLVYFS